MQISNTINSRPIALPAAVEQVAVKAPVIDLTNKLLQNLAINKAQFTSKVAEKFSLLEIGMGAFLSIARWRLDDFAYFVTSALEWFENKIQDIQGTKNFPPLIQNAFTALFKLMNRTNKDGSEIQVADLDKHREAIVGSVNFFSTLPVLIASVFRAVKNLISLKEQVPRAEPSGLLMKAFLYLAPLLNTGAMWLSAAGKAAPAEAMQQVVSKSKTEIYNRDSMVDDYNTTLNSVNEDKLCGLMSAGLAVTPILGKIFPRFDKAIENIYATYISAKSLANGWQGMASGHHDDSPRYNLSAFDHNLMQALEPAKQFVCNLAGIKVPALETFTNLMQKPTDRTTHQQALHVLAV